MCSYILNNALNNGLPLASQYLSNLLTTTTSTKTPHNSDSVSAIVCISNKTLLKVISYVYFYCLPALEHTLYKAMGLGVFWGYTDVITYLIYHRCSINTVY